MDPDGNNIDCAQHVAPFVSFLISHTPSSKMGRFSREKSRPAAKVMSPWMTAFYICAILLAPMLFMGMIPSASAQEATQEKMKSEITGPGE